MGIRDARLGAQAGDEIDAPANDVFLSAATVWELAITTAAGRLELPVVTLAAAAR